MAEIESSGDRKDQHVTRDPPSRYDRVLSGVTSVALALGALVGVAFAVMEWRAHQPSLEFTFADGEIKKIYIDLRETRNNLSELETNFENITGFEIINLRDQSHDLDVTDSSEVMSFNENLKEAKQDYEERAATQKDQGDENAESDYGELISGLEELANKIDSNIKAPLSSHLSIQIDVENRSRLPNVIRGEAVVRLWKTALRFSDIDVYLKENSHYEIKGLEAKRLTFESRFVSQMDEHVQEFLDRSGDVVSGEWNCLMLIKDMRGRVWRKNDVCATDVGARAALLRFEVGLSFQKIGTK